MKIIRPYATVVNPTTLQGALKSIEYAARISHRSEEEMNENTTERFIDAVVLRHGDWSVVEHVSASVEIVTDRGITHEIVRHRIASYTQESTRFVNYAKKMPPAFIYPKPEIECSLCLTGHEPEPQYPQMDKSYTWRTEPWVHRYQDGTTVNCAYDNCWLTAIQNSEDDYRNLLSVGWRPQEARSVFPNALAAKIMVTQNLRSWRHFFLMRTTKEAHPQIRQITIPLLETFKTLVPVLFRDIIPEARQVDNIAKGR